MKMVGYLLAFLLIFIPAADALSITEGQAAIDFKVSGLDGHTISLGEQHGKTVVLVYWKVGQEMSLQALKDIAEIDGQPQKKGVQVISVIADSDDRENAKNIVSENGIGFPVAIDAERTIYGSYGIRVYPTTMIVDRDGKLVYVVASHPQNYKTLLRAYLGKALGELDEAGLEKAISAQEITEDHADAEMNRLYNLALKFNKSGMTGMAIGTAKKAVDAKPDAIKAQILLGYFHLKNADPDSALGVFENILKVDPQSRDAKTGLGSALVEKGDADRALTVLNEALATNPYPQWTYYELGRVYELKGDKDNSLKMYKKAMQKLIDEQVLPEDLSNCK